MGVHCAFNQMNYVMGHRYMDREFWFPLIGLINLNKIRLCLGIFPVWFGNKRGQYNFWLAAIGEHLVSV